MPVLFYSLFSRFSFFSLRASRAFVGHDFPLVCRIEAVYRFASDIGQVARRHRNRGNIFSVLLRFSVRVACQRQFCDGFFSPTFRPNGTSGWLVEGVECIRRWLSKRSWEEMGNNETFVSGVFYVETEIEWFFQWSALGVTNVCFDCRMC